MTTALRYMSEFECLGGACEDTCCGHWRIDVDEAHYRTLERVLAQPEDAERFGRAFTVEPSRGHFAVLQPRDDGACPFLDGARLCELHARFGASVLPDICAQYPRTVSRVGDRRELSGSLGCPEVARRALTVEGAIELVDVAPERLGRGVLTQSAPSGPDWWRPLDRVRWALHAQLGRRDQPLRQRLWRVLRLAERVGEFFNPRVRLVDDTRLSAALLAGEDVTDLDVPDEERAEAIALVLGKLFQLGRARDCPPALARLVASVLEGYAAEPGAPVELAGDDLQADLPALAELHRRRSAMLGAGELDPYLERYGQNYVLREWYGYSPSLSTNVLQLALRVAMLRFLICGHPSFLRLAGAGAERRAGLDAIVVEVAYAFSRAVEHSQRLIADWNGTVEAELTAPEHARRLLAL
jgi:lysine-N-methylase